MKKLRSNIVYYIGLIVISCFVGILLNSINYPSQSRISNQVKNNSKHLLKGIGIVLTKKDGQVCDNINILVSDENPFDYNLKIVNNTNNDIDFIFNIMIDYKQILFKVSSEDYIEKYDFRLHKKSEIEIPLEFNVKNLTDGLHSLLFSLSMNNVNDIDTLNSKPLVSRKNLIKNNNSNPNLLKAEHETHYIELQTPNIFLSKSLDELKKDVFVTSDYIKVKPEGSFNIAILAGGYDDTDTYLCYITLNDDQIKLDNDNDYWCYKVPIKSAAYKEVTISAPKEIGTYKLTAFLIPNPMDNISEIQKPYMPLNSSNLTLSVE